MAQLDPGNRQIISINPGSAVVLSANSIGGNSYMWFRDGVLINDFDRSTFVASIPGVYKVATFNNSGCVSNISAEIQVMLLPQHEADLSISKTSETRVVMINGSFNYFLKVRNNGPDEAINVEVNDVLPTNLEFESLSLPTEGTASFDEHSRTVNWKISTLANNQFSELIIKVKTIQEGDVTNTATVSSRSVDLFEGNNSSTDVKPILGIKIPNVFTPNGDGKNDSFIISDLNKYELNEVTVVNRWGSTVFQSTGYLNDWNAHGLSDGTYFYVVKVKNGENEWLDYKGYVTVIR